MDDLKQGVKPIPHLFWGAVGGTLLWCALAGLAFWWASPKKETESAEEAVVAQHWRYDRMSVEASRMVDRNWEMLRIVKGNPGAMRCMARDAEGARLLAWNREMYQRITKDPESLDRAACDPEALKLWEKQLEASALAF